MIRNTWWCAAVAVLTLGIASCSSSDAPEASIKSKQDSNAADSAFVPPPLPEGTLQEGIQQLSAGGDSSEPNALQPVQVAFETTYGKIVVDLEVEKSPRTVNNFLENYVDTGFYNGTVFHHVENGFMVAGGGYGEDMNPISTRGDILSEADNGLKNTRGTLTMARQPNARNSGNSQFWFNLADNAVLDHQGSETEEDFGYCVFGRVISGMEVLDQIATVPVAKQGNFAMVPQQSVVVKSVKRVK